MDQQGHRHVRDGWCTSPSLSRLACIYIWSYEALGSPLVISDPSIEIIFAKNAASLLWRYYYFVLCLNKKKRKIGSWAFCLEMFSILRYIVDMTVKQSKNGCLVLYIRSVFFFGRGSLLFAHDRIEQRWFMGSMGRRFSDGRVVDGLATHALGQLVPLCTSSHAVYCL